MVYPFLPQENNKKNTGSLSPSGRHSPLCSWKISRLALGGFQVHGWDAMSILVKSLHAFSCCFKNRKLFTDKIHDRFYKKFDDIWSIKMNQFVWCSIVISWISSSFKRSWYLFHPHYQKNKQLPRFFRDCGNPSLCLDISGGTCRCAAECVHSKVPTTRPPRPRSVGGRPSLKRLQWEKMDIKVIVIWKKIGNTWNNLVDKVLFSPFFEPKKHDARRTDMLFDIL